MSFIGPTEAALYLTAGMVLGAVYFALLLRTVRLHASQAAAIRFMPLYFLRFAAGISGFWLIAQQGAGPLLLALLGFLIARMAFQRRIGSE
ncbi:MAG: hypothetical protein OEU25_13425 [Rhodospirillales bacterium]|nr:hypothetical protein [Rhodospirillales bacterium]MDH3919164.1 hypothetical protein [Rhodospirillales bacterium]MDH3966971.1 hypothetical protein [Rhodospirillales bacterium]